MGERRVRNAKVEGSIPFHSTTDSRGPPAAAGGPGFCPARAPILQATIALLVGVLVLAFVAMTAYLLYAQAQRDLGLFWMLVNEPPPAAARS